MSYHGCQDSPSSLPQQTRKPAAAEQSPLARFSLQHHQRWLQPRAEHYLPRSAGRKLPLAVCPHAGAISTSPSLAEKHSCFTGKEKSQASEQWQKCLQPASFQARCPLRFKPKSLGRWLTAAKQGARSGCQAWCWWQSPVQVVVRCAGTALQRGAGIWLLCSSCSCNHPRVRELAQPHGGYLLSSHADDCKARGETP